MSKAQKADEAGDLRNYLLSLSGDCFALEHLSLALSSAIEGSQIEQREKNGLRTLSDHITDRLEALGTGLDEAFKKSGKAA